MFELILYLALVVTLIVFLVLYNLIDRKYEKGRVAPVDYRKLERQEKLRAKQEWEREFKTLLVNSQFRTQRDIDNEKAWDQQMTIEQFMNRIGYKIEKRHD